MDRTEEKRKLHIGIVLMLVSSVCTCTGQLLWKMSPEDKPGMLLYYIIGLMLYGIGACIMIIAFKFGEMSILHPMLSFGFVLSLILGTIFLKEIITWKSVAGVALILIGMIFLGKSAKDKEQ